MTLSPQIRKGIAESLALIGSHPTALPSYARTKAKQTADRAIHDIFHDADWKLWANLNGLLPLLAEASPVEFLNAVQNALEQTPCPFEQLFAMKVEGIFGRSYHTGLLWALEALAWDERFLIGVCLLLGKLAQLDPGGSHSNRPINSLTRVLHPLVRQTTASFQIKMDALARLQEQTPETAWKLLLRVLPNKGGMILSNHRPSWRDTIPDDWEPGVTPWQEIWKQIDTYADMIADMACNDFKKLKDKDLIGELGNLTPSALNRILDHLLSEAVLNQPESKRTDLWTELNKFLRLHKQFPDAKWSLNCEEVSKLEEVVLRLSPTEQSITNKMLYGSEVSLLYEESKDWKESERRRNALRQQAIGEMLSSCGLEEVIRLAENVEHPDGVGQTLAWIVGPEADSQLLPILLEPGSEKLRKFAKAYVWNRWRKLSWRWVDGLDKSKWTTPQAGLFLSWLPFTEESWKRADAWLVGNEAAYWTKADAILPYDYEGETDWAIEKLIQHGRYWAAIQYLSTIHHRKKAINYRLACRALLSVKTPTFRSDQESLYSYYRTDKGLTIGSRDQYRYSLGNRMEAF